jgi:hypothetical protein
MTPEYVPLLDTASRERRRAVLAGSVPAADFLLNTPYQPGRHTLRVSRLKAEVRAQLVSVEHDRHVETGEVRRRLVPLVVETGNQDEVPWGLLPLLDQAAVAEGVAAQVVLPARVRTPCPADRPDLLITAHLLAYQRLVVRHGRGVSVARLVAGVVRDLPGRRGAVMCSRRRDVGHLVAELTALGVDAAGYYSAAHGHTARPPRVAVGTPAGLTSTAAVASGCSVVICLDAVHFSGTGGVDLRSETAWVDALWLGLVRNDRQVSPLERDRLSCFFGPAMLDVPAHDQVRRQVVFTSQVMRPKGRGFDRVVMRLAGELAGGGEGVVTGQTAVLEQAAGIPGPVVVLAQDDGHRHRLQELVRGADRTRARVVTPDQLSRLAVVGVLVRADRRPQCPPLSPQALIEPQTARSPLLVVDAFGPDDDRMTDRRSAEYRAEGWASLAAYQGGYADWERWIHRPLPGQLCARLTRADR